MCSPAGRLACATQTSLLQYLHQKLCVWYFARRFFWSHVQYQWQWKIRSPMPTRTPFDCHVNTVLMVHMLMHKVSTEIDTRKSSVECSHSKLLASPNKGTGSRKIHSGPMWHKVAPVSDCPSRGLSAAYPLLRQGGWEAIFLALQRATKFLYQSTITLSTNYYFEH